MEQQKVDLDALEAALAKSTPISGTTMTSHHIVSKGYEHMANLCRENMGPIAMTYKEESDAIAASYNALPALIAELRELRAYCDKAKAIFAREAQKGDLWNNRRLI